MEDILYPSEEIFTRALEIRRKKENKWLIFL